MSQNPQPNWIVLGVATLALILGIFVLLTDWGSADIQNQGGSFGGMSVPPSNVEFSHTLFGLEAGGEDVGWYDNDFDDNDGIGLLRAGMPIVLIGLVGLVAAVALTAIPPSILAKQRLLSGSVLLGAGIITLLGTILFMSGLISFNDQIADGMGNGYDWSISIGMIFAYIVSLDAIGAGVLAFIMKSGPQIRIAEDAPQKA